MSRDLLCSAVRGQFEAALAMLERCVVLCPDDVWTAPVGAHPFWRVAYHAAFYADLYLSPSEQAFRAQPFHRPDEQFLGRRPWPPHEIVVPGEPQPREAVLAYAAHLREKLRAALDAETDATLAGPSGFAWLPFARAELLLYNLRHVQHHAGQLSAALRSALGSGVEWAWRGGTA